MTLPEFSIRRPVTTIMMIGVLVVLGGYSLYNLGLELLPDMTYPVISVLTTWEGAGPEDIEKMVSQPLEEIVSTISRVKTVKSFSREGNSIVMVEFEWGTNLDFAAQDIRDQISLYKSYLPQDISEPMVFKFDVSVMPAGMFVLTGDIQMERMRQVAEDIIRPQLEQVDGVAAVSILGGMKTEIKIELDKARIENYGLNTQQVISALAYNNINMPAGYITQQNTEFLLRTYGEYKSVEEIRDIVVGMTKNYLPIHLKDVAKITKDYKSRRGISEMNEKLSLWIMISKESSANVVKVMNRVNKEVGRIQKNLPPGVNLQSAFDMSSMVKRISSQTSSTALQGAVLAALLILLFLGSWRPTLAISIAIPLSVITTFIAIYALGYTINMMTLVGLALGVGMLVDNAIVVIENIHRHIELGYSPIKSAGKGAAQVGMAITASTLTTIAVFFPVLLAGGIVGKLAKPLALTITVSLLASLFVALSIVPVIASQIFSKKHAGQMKATKWFSKIQSFYVKSLNWAVRHRWKVIIFTLGFALLSLGLIPFLGGEFIPEFEMEFDQLMFYLPPGTPMEESIKIARSLIQPIQSDPDVILYGFVVGVTEEQQFDLALGTSPTAPNEGQVLFRVVEKSKRKRKTMDISNDVKRQFPVLRGGKIVRQDMSGFFTGSTVGGDIQVKIFGPSHIKLMEIAEWVSQEIEKLPGVSDVDISMKKGRPEARIIIDREKSARLGLTTGEIANAIKLYTLGSLAGRFNDQGKLIDIKVYLDSEQYNSLEEVLNFPIVSRTGAVIPLGQVAQIQKTTGPMVIEREERQRKIDITASVKDGDLRKTSRKVEKLMEKFSKSPRWPNEYTYKVGGETEQMRDMFVALGIALLAAFLLVYMVMASQFESFLYPFVVMFTQPLAAIGVLWGLFLTGQKISMPSMLGIIILAGIVVNNGIVLVDFINQLRKEGKELFEAIIEAGRLRLRPVLITALTTIIGMAPMILSRSEGSEMRIPIAVSISAGLATATFLTLFVIPCVYAVFTGLSERALISAQKLFGIQQEKEDSGS